MLGIRRAALRDWLVERGETWIEDPANGNLAYARARARPSIDPGAKVVRFDPPALKLAAQATHRAGVITLSRTALREVSVPDAHRFVALAGVSAGGGARLPASARINRAVQALRGEAIVKATLAGARLEADDRDIHVFREAGEAARGGLMPITPEPGLSFIWDGRFEIAASFAGAEVRRLAGLVGRLPSAQRAELRSLPPAARSGLPATLDVLGYAGCLTLTGQAESLVAARFAAEVLSQLGKPAAFKVSGLKVDDKACIRMKNGSMAKNIFAAGEIMSGNILGKGYLAGFGMTIGTVFGRIAGKQAAIAARASSKERAHAAR